MSKKNIDLSGDEWDTLFQAMFREGHRMILSGDPKYAELNATMRKLIEQLVKHVS